MKNPSPRAVVCFGEALIDFRATPPREADAPRAFIQQAGGAPANVAVAVARLGGRAAFIGMLGADMFGDFLHASLAAAGVDVRQVVRTAEANTALAFVSLDADGERSFSFYRPPAADLLFEPRHFAADAFAGAGVLHVCSNSLTEASIAAATLDGMRRARAAGALVSLDLNLRPALWPTDADPTPRLWAALREADLVKLAADELAFLAAARDERGVLDELLDARAQAVIVTDGAAPLRWFTRAASGALPAFAVCAVDTTAAGDAFVGGLLYRLAQRGVDAATLAAWCADREARQADLRFAAAAGALCTTRHGAFDAMPTLAEVLTLTAETA